MVADPINNLGLSQHGAGYPCPPTPKKKKKKKRWFSFQTVFQSTGVPSLTQKKPRPFEDWKFGPVEFGRRYGWHFPEMGKIVTENLAYAKAGKELERF